NHLTGVIGAIEMVGDDQASLEPGEVEEFLELAHQQAVEAGEVLDDLLIASRTERGALDALPELVDLCPLTETVIRRTSVEGHEIGFQCYGGPVWAMADPLRYKQILRNLLTNALRYGGDNIRVSVESFDHTVSVVVADDGDGVDPEFEHALFQAYRAGMAMARVPGSSGLGLWIARGLAHKMGGNLRYQREAGLTVFELILPSAEAPPSDSALAELAASSTLV
ncbi:MAG TPA: HAMP domain-containing sensor histidine kinase, partial [Acidimicrobiia bacterium]|nr:HAMP domain-containing sensor histidine kinase [Acidimicrobiia bacterium]